MNREQFTTESVAEVDSQKETEFSIIKSESPHELGQQMADESKGEVIAFQEDCSSALIKAEALAEKDGLTIDSEDKGALQELIKQANIARRNLMAKITNIHYLLNITLNQATAQLAEKSKDLLVKVVDGANEKRREEKREKLIEKLGSSLEISEIDSLSVKKHLEHLSLLPDTLLETMMRIGMKVRIGNKDVPGLSNDNPIFKESPRGWAGKTDWSGVSGCFHSAEKRAYAGKLHSGGSNSIVLHEYGHGVGEFLALDDSQDTIDAHIRLYDKLVSYLQQDGPGGLAGRQEFLAESFADFFVISRGKFIKQYDESWYSYLEKNVNQDNPT